MSTCAVPSCKNYFVKTKRKGIAYHKFPKDQSMARKWMQACQMSNLKPKRAVVCGEHFNPDDYMNYLQIRMFGLSEKHILKPTAVPSKLLQPEKMIDSVNLEKKQIRDERTRKRNVLKRALERLRTLSPKRKKGGSSLQKSNDSNVLPAGQCSNSTSTSLMSSSDIVIKQEIIETESESSIFDDASFHSSIADGPSEAQFDGQRPSTSYVTCSESSNSNTDYILPGGHNDVVSSAPTQSQISRTVKVEPDVSSNSCGVVSEKNCRNESILPGVSSQIGSSSFSLGSSNHGSSWTNESTQSKVPSHSNPPFRSKDRFDIFGEFVASKLRNLDSKSSAFIQTTFSDLLFKAELGMFSERGEKGFSDAQTDYAGKSPNKNTHGSSEKENVQPGSSSHIENTLQDFSLTQRSPRDDIQHRSPSHRTNQLSPPVANSTSPENALSNEPIQLASHTENPLPPVESVTVSENSSRTSPNQTGVSVLPSGSPVLHTANSWSGTHIQPTIPLHMRPRDDFDVYGEFVASKLRSLDPRSCAFVQTAFADLIFKGELGRFVSEGEHNFFANKTNNLLWNLPSNNPQKNVVSSSEPQTRFNLITPNICADPIPMEIIPNLHFVQK
ncbi:serine-rich adhesin for platelets isoform X11 [Parasteatoda tepidariorum]|uniref:serine-rich adhesin for platelets isoform X11 n=1 Tax=Parasteatoda tepidariorum TaxID=114398 RepID=UPI001C727636|nr:uncharacterized protein LOC107450690 isoform X10 [Parasteatoda tepidariorum]